MQISDLQDSIKKHWDSLSKNFSLCKHHNEYKGVGWEFVISLHSVNSKRLRTIANKHNLSDEDLFKLEQLFLNEYLPKTLIELFSKYKWIFDWKRVGANKRWIALVDAEVSRYYNEDKNELSLHNFGDADLERLRDLLTVRQKQLTDIGRYINKIMDDYGDQYCNYLETKIGSI